MKTGADEHGVKQIVVGLDCRCCLDGLRGDGRRSERFAQRVGKQIRRDGGKTVDERLPAGKRAV